MMLRSTAWVALLVLMTGLIVTFNRSESQIRRWDSAFAAWIEANTPLPYQVQPEVVIIEIDQRAVELAGGWPWQPLDYALFLRAIGSFNPSVVVIDHPPVWTSPSRSDLAPLETWALRTPRLAIAARPTKAHTSSTVAEKSAESDAADSLASPVGRFIGSLSALPVMEDAFVLPSPAIAQAASVAPLLTWLQDGPAVVSAPLLLARGGHALPTLILESARLHLRALPAEVVAAPGAELVIKDHTLALAEDGSMPIDLRLLNLIPRWTFSDLLVEAKSGEASPLASLIRDRIVVLGRVGTDVETLPTASGRPYPPVELVAASLATLLDGIPPREAPTTAWLIITGAICLLALTMGRFGFAGFLRLVVVVACTYFAAASALLYHRHLLLPVSLPAILLALLVLVKLATSRSKGLQGRRPSYQSS